MLPTPLHLIDGRRTPAADGRTFPVVNPADGQTISEVPLGGAAEARAAIEGAASAFPGWRDLPAHERARPLRALAEAMVRDQQRLAHLMTLEQGKPLAEARGEILYAASFLEWSAEEARRICGQVIPASSVEKRIVVLRQPVGVCLAITPWNFPAAMITRKVGPALACGCTMIVKPAEQTPLSALAIGELAMQVGIPQGVLNIITGDAPQIAAACFADPRVRKVTFTGSTDVGRVLVRQAADNLQRLTLELGGHAPFIVFEDADIDAALAGVMASKFRNSGQTCICANRLLVHRSIIEPFTARLAEHMRALKVGAGLEPGVTVGPLIDDAAVEKVESHVADAVERGAVVRVGGSRAMGTAMRCFLPTLLERCTPEMRCWCEETFGPVLPVASFETEDQAVAMANDTPYGLAAYFYTRDASRLMRVAERLEFGVIGANDALPSTAQAPFGGMKQSGWGREGGAFAIDAYTEIKYMSWRL
ncbi:MAG: NAD-dependent succinate-semialdehyde dehydrogenase [Phycisphaeraceae bacterium]|nr:NAD-dependent succinate-semialdehyde dehydrogenase [Phycisphaeraceae bacterium]MCW5753630.1 NAD-dependent succinate-semialdehyde dehydrogenase [Phycisphaeraceae bacterium]